MGLQDLVVTPFYLALFYAIGYLYNRKFNAKEIRKYFFPALSLKFLGAIFLGIIYQFYYQGGDTFNFWTHGSEHIWNAIREDWQQGLSMIFGDIKSPQNFQYYEQIWLRRSDSNLFVIKIAAFFDLFTFHTYSATALFFALYSFSGSWAVFTNLVQLYPNHRKFIALSLFFIPSVGFWGSGIMKDSIVLGALGWAIACLIRMVEMRKYNVSNLLLLILSIFLIYKIKIYIAICLIPAIFIWLYLKNLQKIKLQVIKVILAPLLITAFAVAGYYSASLISSESERYSLDRIPEWSMITAYDIGFWTGKDAGSNYSLGELDGTWETMISYAPAAINVTLFRPYLWEANSVLMMITALESLIFFVLCLYILLFRRRTTLKVMSKPMFSFLLIYSLVFAFAVGVSTFNFGTLARYRIPMLPYFGIVIAAAITKNNNLEFNYARFK